MAFAGMTPTAVAVTQWLVVALVDLTSVPGAVPRR